tara:strand:- start:370 stop:2004 length:1635 start_codon:yes stop_codon:yes gene_type:complete
MLADVKHRYSELSQAQRDEFDAWARSLRQADLDRRRLGEIWTRRVRLHGGTGKRARWNGTHATLVPGTRRNGWVDVDHPAAKRMPWRHGGCTAVNDVVIDLDPAIMPALPTELIALVLVNLPLSSRMWLLTVCKAWAACTEHSDAWKSIVTPQSAGQFTSSRLARLIELAGASLRELDLGYEAGLGGWNQGIVNLGDGPAAAAPQHPVYLRLMQAQPWHSLIALRLRQFLPWLPTNRLADAVAQCTAIQELDVSVPGNDGDAAAVHAHLRRLCRPTLRSLRLRFHGSFPRDRNSEALVTQASLPITDCPQLHSLYLSNAIKGGHHRGPLLYDAPASLKTLKVLAPSGGIEGFMPNLPHVEHLHLKLLKTAGFDGTPPVRGSLMHNLRTLHLSVQQYGPVFLGQMYVSLVSCIQLAYLRIDLQNSAQEGLESEGDENRESIKQKLEALMGLPDMWFCEAPHELPLVGGWQAVPCIMGEVAAWREQRQQQMRAVRTALLRNHEKAHLTRLQQNSEALLPIFNQEQHPDLTAALEAEAGPNVDLSMH